MIPSNMRTPRSTLNCYEIVRAGCPSSGGRVYSRETCRTAVDSFNEMGEVIGMLAEEENSCIIKLGAASHVVKGMYFREENDKLMAYIIPLETPHGKLLNELISAGVRPRFNLAGVGSVSHSPGGLIYVNQDWKFVTINSGI